MNVNLRPYYAEGSKTMGFEIAEQLGWKLPRHTVVPMASGSLLTKIHKAYKEFTQTGLIEEQTFTIHGAQASGCSPISNAMKRGTEIVKPVPNPDTIVKSLAIGTPADGYYAIRTMKDSRRFRRGRQRRGSRRGHPPSRRDGGHFCRDRGRRDRRLREETHRDAARSRANESVVLCITGHGLKTQEAIHGKCGEPRLIKPSLREFEALIADEVGTTA